MTSQWRDADTSSMFQEFLRKRREREHEKAAARVKRHASADRRKDLLNSHRSDEKGEVITQVVKLFVDGLLDLEELKVAHAQGEADWEVLGSKSVGGLFAKWCSTPGGMHDKALGLATLILISEKLLKVKGWQRQRRRTEV